MTDIIHQRTSSSSTESSFHGRLKVDKHSDRQSIGRRSERFDRMKISEHRRNGSFSVKSSVVPTSSVPRTSHRKALSRDQSSGERIPIPTTNNLVTERRPGVFKRLFGCVTCSNSRKQINPLDMTTPKDNCESDDEDDRLTSSDRRSSSVSTASGRRISTREIPREGKYRKAILPAPHPSVADKPTLVLDLDETLVHSHFEKVDQYHLYLKLQSNGSVFEVYVVQRPYLLEFLQEVGDDFEIVLWTASLKAYALPVMQMIEKESGVKIHHKLFRDSCVESTHGYFVKDLTKLGRDIKRTLIIDNCRESFLWQPQNGIHIRTWISDPKDVQLLEMLPTLKTIATSNDDVRDILNRSTEGSTRESSFGNHLTVGVPIKLK